MMTMSRLPFVLLYSHDKMTDNARVHTTNCNGGRCLVGSEINSGRCQRAQTTPSSNAAQMASRRRCILGRAKPRQPTSSKSPTMTIVDSRVKPTAPKSVYAPLLRIGVPMATASAAATTAITNGPNRAMRYQIGCTRQRVSWRSKAHSSFGPPASRETITAAISGPNGTSGLLVGFKITNGQSAHDSRYASVKYSSRSCRAAQLPCSELLVLGSGPIPCTSCTFKTVRISAAPHGIGQREYWLREGALGTASRPGPGGLQRCRAHHRAAATGLVADINCGIGADADTFRDTRSTQHITLAQAVQAAASGLDAGIDQQEVRRSRPQSRSAAGR